jgi:oligosaccharide repeat unit polymerase
MINIKNNLKNIDVFNPLIIVFAIILFVLIALPIWYLTTELHTPKLPMYFFILFGLFLFILGNYVPIILEKYSNTFKNKLKILKSLSNKNLEPLPLFGNYSKTEQILLFIVILGIFLQAINLIFLGGIPLFSSTLKSQAATKIWLISYILYLPGINLLLAKYNRKTHYLLLIIGLILFVLTGYRTTPIAILLSTFITLYYTRNFETKHQLLFLSVIIILFIAIGFIAVKSISGQHWRIGPLELVSYRAGFTLNIFDKVTRRQFLTHGNLFYSTLTGFFSSVDPRVLVGQAVLNQNHSITSTIFGPATLDFGLCGMGLQMFLIGLILKSLHIIQKYKKEVFTAFYAIILAQTLIWIETGPTDLVVWIFYLISILLILFCFHKIKNMEHN